MGDTLPLIDRLRMRLAWMVMPRSANLAVKYHLVRIKREAKRIEESSFHPSQVRENAQSIERRTCLLLARFLLSDERDYNDA